MRNFNYNRPHRYDDRRVPLTKVHGAERRVAQAALHRRPGIVKHDGIDNPLDADFPNLQGSRRPCFAGED